MAFLHIPVTQSRPMPHNPVSTARALALRSAVVAVVVSVAACAAPAGDKAADSAAAATATDSAATPAAEAPASPRDSVSLTVGDATISVNYGRPSKRGRTIFNGLSDMKWGMVWRTGANEATSFVTSKALMFGTREVPAGSYTLFTKLSEDLKWDLVVNKQTGQWGTEYNEAQDLVRIPMTVTATNPVVEKMEIQLVPAGNGGELVIQWDTYKATAAFAVKQ